ncbi:MAG: hypothetical protein ACTSRO_03005 [Candidatus Heimdallarchaeaceae archaeon]
MAEDSKQEQSKKKKEKKRRIKPKSKGERSDFWKNLGKGLLTFFVKIGKCIKAFFKYCLFPFWYTGVLFVETFKFLRTRNDEPLTDKDKNYLSLIPTLFFMFGICILLLYLLFATPVFETTKELIQNQSFWQSVGQWFIDLWNGFVELLKIIFVDFFWGMIVQPFADVLSTHQWVSAFILLIAVILVIGLSILIYNFAKRGKIFIILRDFFQKIGRKIKQGHEAIKRFVLKYLIGERYILTRSKNFFWTNVLLQFILTIIFIIFSIYLVVQQYQLGNWDTSVEIMNFAAVAAGMLFLLVGVFATWFFTLVHGVSTSPIKTTSTKEE